MSKKVLFVVTLVIVVANAATVRIAPAIGMGGALLINGLLLPAEDLSQQLLIIKQLVEGKEYAEAIVAYENLLQKAPQSLRGSVQFEIAGLYAVLGNTDRSLAIMEQAIQSGFDDCLAIQQNEKLNAAGSDPRFKEFYSRVRVSEADLKELYWLKAEIQNVSHETKMMIMANTTRMDGGITVIPQSAVPARETVSSGVLFNRELLRMMHQLQRQYVFEADKARIRHVTTMITISGRASYEQMARSSRLAALAAEERKRAIEARKFTLPPGMGAIPRSCSE
jgi:tetratricopeptide (TPR) repeat protein